MRDTYFSINECTEDELNELRETLFWADLSNGYKSQAFQISDEDIEFLEDCECSEEIPFSLLERAFEGFTFVDEDFWCNCIESVDNE